MSEQPGTDREVIVWAVVYGNYFPGEVEALYDNEAAAQAHVEASEDPLEVRPMTVQSEKTARQPDV